MINLEGLSADAIELVFSTLPTAVGIATYYKGAGSVDYDPVSDQAAAPIAVKPNVRMMPLAIQDEELVGTPVTVSDLKVIIPAGDLGPIKPGTEDWFELRGVRYNVLKKKVLPVSTIHILYARAR